MKGNKSKKGKTSGAAMGGRSRLKVKPMKAGNYFAGGVAHAKTFCKGCK